MDMGVRTWNIRSLYRASFLMTVSKEVSKYKLDLVGVQEVRWEGSGTKKTREYTFLYGKGNENHELGKG
jgi:exonuclease III